MGLEEFVDDKTPESSSGSSSGGGNPFLQQDTTEAEVTPVEDQEKNRVVRAELSLSRYYENVTEEEAVEMHKEWVYKMARAIEENNSKVKLTDWTALEHRVTIPSDSDVENFYSE